MFERNYTMTVTLANQPSTPADVAINHFTYANFLRTSAVVSADGLRKEATYELTSGDPTKPTIVTATQRVDVKNNVVHSTIRLETVQTVTDADDVVLEEAPIAITIGVSAPGRMEDTAAVLSLIGSAFGLWYTTLTSKVPQPALINKINRGGIDALFG